MTKDPKLEEYRRLAGECVKCMYYDFDEAEYTIECYQCKRFWCDRFEDKEGEVGERDH